MSGLDIDPFTANVVKRLCDRHLGIGADGLMIPRKEDGYDFRMVYYNSDGHEGSFCGNGSRCISYFMKSSGYVGSNVNFIAADGPHFATIYDDKVKVRMKNVSEIEKRSEADFFLDTGSPHYVRFVDEVNDMDLVRKAHEIRYNSVYTDEGTNVNFVAIGENGISVRTYERGVEDETLSCGTGVVAAALASFFKLEQEPQEMKVHTRGGVLQVKAKRSSKGFDQVDLIGPVKLVFTGEVDLGSIAQKDL